MSKPSRSQVSRSVSTLERGHIYFAYRPRVDVTVVRGPDDVQRLDMILSPRGRDSYRLLVVGEKRLPAPDGDRTTWAFVDKVSSDPEEIEDELDLRTYLTRTRGERHRPPARPAGEGVYAVVRHRGHTHLVYVLELPRELGEVQRGLNIAREASDIVVVKNPKTPSEPGLGLDEARRARFPRGLAQRFRGRRFINLDPPDFLDHEGAEIVLIATGADVHELGLTLDREHEHEDEETAAIFEDLRLEKSLHPIAPLLKGTWE
jgi:hypothetical protein